MSRPIGVQSKVVTFIVAAPQVDTLDQHICVDAVGVATPGNLYSLNLSWSGATVGDEIFIYDDAAAVPNVTTAKKFLAFRVPTTAGSFAFALPAVGKRAYAGMFLHPICAPGGTYNLDFGLSNGNG